MLERGPLVAAHRPGPGVRQQVDEDVVRVEREEVPSGGLDRRRPLVTGREPDRFHRVDTERLDDRPVLVHRCEHRRVRDRRDGP